MNDQADNKKPVIAVKDIWKRFGSHTVLKGLSLDVYPGETVVILGRSGAGKSVLLKQIIGLSKPDSGTIDVQGKRISDMTPRQIAEDVTDTGMLFQSAALFDSMTIADNTSFYLREHKSRSTGQWLSANDVKDQVAKALKMVGLEGTENKMPADLSGGMRRRAALARLIVYHPQILLYDEPTAGLDPVTAMHINELIHKTQQELKVTSIVVTHDLRSAAEVGDRIALHNDGKIAIIAPKTQFFSSNDELVRAFINNSILPEEYLPAEKQHHG